MNNSKNIIKTATETSLQIKFYDASNNLVDNGLLKKLRRSSRIISKPKHYHDLTNETTLNSGRKGNKF